LLRLHAQRKAQCGRRDARFPKVKHSRLGTARVPDLWMGTWQARRIGHHPGPGGRRRTRAKARPGPSTREYDGMAQELRRLMDRLTALIAHEQDAVDDYRAALRHVEELHIRVRLSELQSQHRRHVQELVGAVGSLGGRRPRLAVNELAVSEAPSPALAPMGTASTLRALLGEERLGCARYLEALSEPWPQEVRALLESHLAEEKDHLTFIEEAIRDRPWGQAPAQLT
ncbi:MAG: ferritin-like domain-containing protein, partial [Myxococcaceae bacterium]|nr:ferritin-like domain-containing protein [Myxococcaceae bacterium]